MITHIRREKEDFRIALFTRENERIGTVNELVRRTFSVVRRGMVTLVSRGEVVDKRDDSRVGKSRTEKAE
ncbi:MAG TPA: hypothetical protein VED45_05445 [Steroidobacteraceae bacterium]|nr:hypothetical protein [Steroidobacteraceae bacterium]